MRKLVDALHLPLAGVMLAFATLGNLLGMYWPFVKNICGIISAVLLVGLILKLCITPQQAKKDLENPVIASSFPTFDMGIMVLATYLVPYVPTIAKIIWILALALHFVLIAFVTRDFILIKTLPKIFPSFFVTFVGFVVASVTSPAVNMIKMGQIVFYLGLVLYVLIGIVIVYRMYKHPEMPAMAHPSKVIFAAPASLLLTGYLTSFPAPNRYLVLILAALSLVMTVLGVYYLITSVKKDFFTSYASYTFPFVISALAMTKFSVYAANTGFAFASLVPWIAKLETGIAIFTCLYTLYRFADNFVKKMQQADV